MDYDSDVESNEFDYLPRCACCGVPRWKYELWGHSKECVRYEPEMYEIVEKWQADPELLCGLQRDWKTRYDHAVTFLLDQIKHLKENKSNRVQID